MKHPPSYVGAVIIADVTPNTFVTTELFVCVAQCDDELTLVSLNIEKAFRLVDATLGMDFEILDFKFDNKVIARTAREMVMLTRSPSVGEELKTRYSLVLESLKGILNRYDTGELPFAEHNDMGAGAKSFEGRVVEMKTGLRVVVLDVLTNGTHFNGVATDTNVMTMQRVDDIVDEIGSGRLALQSMRDRFGGLPQQAEMALKRWSGINRDGAKVDTYTPTEGPLAGVTCQVFNLSDPADFDRLLGMMG